MKKIKSKIILLVLVLNTISCCLNCVLDYYEVEQQNYNKSIQIFTFHHNHFCSPEKLQPFALNEIYNYMRKHNFKTFEILNQYKHDTIGGIYYYLVKFNN